jgi:hypothetical protein
MTLVTIATLLFGLGVFSVGLWAYKKLDTGKPQPKSSRN